MNTLEKVQQIFMQHLDIKIEHLHPQRRLRNIYDTGEIDSLGMIEVVLSLEETFDIDIPDEDMARVELHEQHTIADLVRYLDERRNA